MAHPVVHWEIAAKNSDKLQEFYSKLFAWKIDSNNPMNYGAVETGGEGGICGGIFKAEGEIPPYVTFYVQVDDLQAHLDKAVSLGGKQIVPPTPIPNVGHFAMFTDPEGNVIGLFKK
jgi:hypothetical protein